VSAFFEDSRAFLLALLTAFIAAVSAFGLGCGAHGDSQHDEVAAGREAGLKPYWLGTSLLVGDAPMKLTSTKFYGPTEPQLAFFYRLGNGSSGLATIATYSRTGGGWNDYLDAARMSSPTSIKPVNVGSWSGEVWILPSANRPVNVSMYVLQIDDEVVIATANATSTGIPETDANPLVDAKVWQRVLEEHLRPYPE
jgi:hypothetical protein